MQKPAHAVIVISSHVIRGAVGNRVVGFTLESMGHPVWALPTVIMPWHPGQGPSTRILTDDALFETVLAELAASNFAIEVKAVISGYFSSTRQVEAVGHLVKALRQRNPDLLYLCDPVLGDDGGLYIAEPVAAKIRDVLIPEASIVTPNRFELGWLTGRDLHTNNDLIVAGLSLGPKSVLVTSAYALMAQSVANLLIEDGKAVLAEHRKIDGLHSGTGDLFAATFLARLLQGANAERALQLASASVFEIVARSVRKHADGLLMAEEADSLRNPTAMVQMRQLRVAET
jgi:pyridoxine kinase